jgi:outer membrane protein TolC
MSNGKLVSFLIVLGAAAAAGRLGAQQVGPEPITTYQPLPSPAAKPTLGQFQGSVPQGQASPNAIALTLEDAINRGLKANLGLLVSEQADRETQATRIRTLSALLPEVTAGVTTVEEQINLKTFGLNFTLPPSVPFSFPTVVGPFHYQEANAFAKVPVLDLAQLRNYQATKERGKAAQLNLKDARDLVVEAVGNAYLKIIASAAEVVATEAQVTTADVLFRRASDMKGAGVSPAIDVLRAQVELKRQQQVLLAEQNQFEKDKLILARVIGLPLGQQFTVADPTSDAPMEAISEEEALTRAYQHRSDYQAAASAVRAAELARRAAHSQWYPTISVQGNYGDSGTNFGSSHGVFEVAGSVNFNIFDGHKIRADELQADSGLTNRRNELEDLRGQIDYQVRAALLDLKSTAQQVDVAKSNVQLAQDTLTQARDRFAAGVADNLEVVQAQQSVADANQNVIAAQYSNNVARVELARALGLAEEGIRGYFTRH